VGDATARRLVWGAWAAATFAALALVLECGPRFPWQDDFALVTRLTGAQEFSWRWLWNGYNDHRFPLSMLVLLGLHSFAGGDHRLAMAFSVALLAAVAALALASLRRARGRTCASDAVVPLAFLHFGHWPNLLLSFQLWMVLTAAITCAWIASFAAASGRLSTQRALLAALGVACLPLLGGAGALSTPALAGASLAIALWVARDRARGSRAAAAILCAGALVALATFAAYVTGFERTFNEQNDDSLGAQLATLARFFSQGVGPSRFEPWRASAAVALALVGLAGVASLALLREPARRRQGLALLGGIGALASLGVGIAWGRSAPGYEPGLEERYATLLLPLALLVAFSIELAASERWRAPLRGAFAVLTLAGALNGTLVGWNGAAAVRDEALRFESAVAEGASSRELAARFVPWMFPSESDLARLLAELRRAQLPPFDRGAPGPEVDRGVGPFASFARQPVLGFPEGRIAARELGGREVAALLDPGELLLELAGDERTLALSFGLLPEANRRCDGLEFALVWRPRTGPERTLLARELFPARDGEPQPEQRVELELPGGPATLALLTRNAPSRHSRWDRGYFADLELR
jgi:hypothetical protein